MSRFYYQIALPVKIFDTFTYHFDSNQKIKNGTRVLVSFGNKVLTGIVVNTISDSSGYRTKDIIKILENEPILSSKMLEYLQWVSRYYISPIGLTLFSAIPNSVISKQNFEVRITAKGIETLPNASGLKKKILQFLSLKNKFHTQQQVERKIGSKSIRKYLEQLDDIGQIESRDKIRSESSFVFDNYLKFNEELFHDENLDSKFKEFRIRSEKQKSVIKFFLANSTLFDIEISQKYLIENTGADLASIKKLNEKGILEIIKRKRSRAILPDRFLKKSKNELEITPNDEQRNAINTIWTNQNSQPKKPILIHGITGSGKTLVYIHSIKRFIDNNQDVIVILPEISLTHQLLNRFEIAFPNKVFLYHSDMATGTKHDTFYEVKNGDPGRLILGARSAIFAPSENLGMIIIDEEHDHSLKQTSPDPKYNARDCAIIRSKFFECQIVLGSATPSLETYFNVEEDRYILCELTQRTDGAKLPEVKVVDYLQAKKTANVEGIFTKLLLDKIFDRIAKKEQIILFINRRGYSSFLECTNCGNIPMCNNCDVALTYHKSSNKLVCHICSEKHSTDLRCDSCGYDSMVKVGMGTQKVEDSLQKIIEKRKIDINFKRLDSDSVTNKKLNHELEAFANHEYDIIIGTQLISKGLDFENVTLVGVINADLELYRSDFRASENTFALISQVAGRAGRNKLKPGEVVIQSNHPENYAIQFAKEHNFKGFYEKESRIRKRSAFPPIVRFITIEITGKNESKVNVAAYDIYHELNKPNTFMTVFEPVIPSLSRRAGMFRRIIVVKDFKQMDGSGRKFRERYLEIVNLDKFKSSSIRISLDMDSIISL